jgi:hypothetical protein
VETVRKEADRYQGAGHEDHMQVPILRVSFGRKVFGQKSTIRKYKNTI